MTPRLGKKQKGGEKKEIDYNKALSLLGLIPGMGAAGKALGKVAKKAKKTAKKKKGKKQPGGAFNTVQGSFVEPGIEQI